MDGLYLSIERRRPELPGDVRRCPGFESFPDLHGQEYGFGFWMGREYWLHVHRVGSFVFRHGAHKVTGFPESGLDAAYFREAFFHGVAPWLLQRGPWDCLHASAVLEDGRVVIFCGPSGRGKSTLAGGWAREGAMAYGDDAVPFVIRGDAALAARLPQRVRLRGLSESHFPEFPNPVEEFPPGPDVRCDFSATLRPIRGVFWMDPMRPPSAEEGVQISRLPPKEAFPLLLTAAHCMTMSDPDCNRKMVHNYLSLSRLAPFFRLSVVADLERLPAVVESIRKELARVPSPA